MQHPGLVTHVLWSFRNQATVQPILPPEGAPAAASQTHRADPSACVDDEVPGAPHGCCQLSHLSLQLLWFITHLKNIPQQVQTDQRYTTPLSQKEQGSPQKFEDGPEPTRKSNTNIINSGFQMKRTRALFMEESREKASWRPEAADLPDVPTQPHAPGSTADRRQTQGSPRRADAFPVPRHSGCSPRPAVAAELGSSQPGNLRPASPRPGPLPAITDTASPLPPRPRRPPPPAAAAAARAACGAAPAP